MCLLSGLEKFAISTKDFMSEHLCVEKLILKPPGIFFLGLFEALESFESVSQNGKYFKMLEFFRWFSNRPC